MTETGEIPISNVPVTPEPTSPQEPGGFKGILKNFLKGFAMGGIDSGVNIGVRPQTPLIPPQNPEIKKL